MAKPYFAIDCKNSTDYLDTLRNKHPKCGLVYDEFNGDRDCLYGANILCEDCKYGMGDKDSEDHVHGNYGGIGMEKSHGFTLVEVLVVAIFSIIVFGAVVGLFLDNMAHTEKRAEENAKIFVTKNNIHVKRMTCAGDSDNDGYGSCAITTTDGERINLRCPASFFQVGVFGATGCKEVFYDMDIRR